MKHALKNKVKTFDVKIIDSKDPAKQLSETKLAVARELENLLNKQGGFKFIVTLKITLKTLDIEWVEEYFIFKDAYLIVRLLRY